jgi:putative transposase
LEEALTKARPEIFNTDQGSQFTSHDFTGILKSAGVTISMDGKGRVFDNIFVERLWRTVKYEAVYISDYRTVRDAREGLGRYFDFYNNERIHQALDYKTPLEVYQEADNAASLRLSFAGAPLRDAAIANQRLSTAACHLKPAGFWS